MRQSLGSHLEEFIEKLYYLSKIFKLILSGTQINVIANGYTKNSLIVSGDTSSFSYPSYNSGTIFSHFKITKEKLSIKNSFSLLEIWTEQ